MRDIPGPVPKVHHNLVWRFSLHCLCQSETLHHFFCLELRDDSWTGCRHARPLHFATMPVVARICSVVCSSGQLRRILRGSIRFGSLFADCICLRLVRMRNERQPCFATVIFSHRTFNRKGTSSLWRNWQDILVVWRTSSGGCTACVTETPPLVA